MHRRRLTVPAPACAGRRPTPAAPGSGLRRAPLHREPDRVPLLDRRRAAGRRPGARPRLRARCGGADRSGPADRSRRPASPPVAANVTEFYAETYRGRRQRRRHALRGSAGRSVKSLVWFSPRVFAARGYRVRRTGPSCRAVRAQRGRRAHPVVPPPGPGRTPAAAGGRAGGHIAGTGRPRGVRRLGRAHHPHRLAAAVRAGRAGPDRPQRCSSTADRRPGQHRQHAGGRWAGSRSAPGLPAAPAGRPLRRRWPTGTDISPDGDVFAFRLPPPARPDTGPTALVGGGFVVAFSDRREVAAVQAHLSTPDAATAMARELGPGWLSPNSGLDYPPRWASARAVGPGRAAGSADRAALRRPTDAARGWARAACPGR